ncbi:hypothetical protein [Streptomyces prunicolor]|nr:hypothetical protein [Streptomyces prunicolor]
MPDTRQLPTEQTPFIPLQSTLARAVRRERRAAARKGTILRQ